MPTFGDLTAGADTFPCSDGRLLLGLFTLSEDADVTEIAVRFDSTSGSGASAKGIIYNGAAGGALRLATTGQAVPSGGGLLTWAVSGLTLAPGDFYLGSITSDFQPVWQCDSGTGARVEDNYASPSANLGTINSAGAIPDVYVTYDVPGGARGKVLGGKLVGGGVLLNR